MKCPECGCGLTNTGSVDYPKWWCIACRVEYTDEELKTTNLQNFIK